MLKIVPDDVRANKMPLVIWTLRSAAKWFFSFLITAGLWYGRIAKGSEIIQGSITEKSATAETHDGANGALLARHALASMLGCSMIETGCDQHSPRGGRLGSDVGVGQGILGSTWVAWGTMLHLWGPTLGLCWTCCA